MDKISPLSRNLPRQFGTTMRTQLSFFYDDIIM